MPKEFVRNFVRASAPEKQAESRRDLCRMWEKTFDMQTEVMVGIGVGKFAPVVQSVSDVMIPDKRVSRTTRVLENTEGFHPWNLQCEGTLDNKVRRTDGIEDRVVSYIENAPRKIVFAFVKAKTNVDRCKVILGVKQNKVRSGDATCPDIVEDEVVKDEGKGPTGPVTSIPRVGDNVEPSAPR